MRPPEDGYPYTGSLSAIFSTVVMRTVACNALSMFCASQPHEQAIAIALASTANKKQVAIKA